MKKFLKLKVILSVTIILIIFAITVTINGTTGIEKLEKTSEYELLMKSEKEIITKEKGKEENITVTENNKEIQLTYEKTVETLDKKSKYDVYKDTENNEYKVDVNTKKVIGYMNYSNPNFYGSHLNPNGEKTENPIDLDRAVEIGRKYIEDIYGSLEEYTLLLAGYSEGSERYEVFYYKEIDEIKIHNFVYAIVGIDEGILMSAKVEKMDFTPIMDCKIDRDKIQKEIERYLVENNIETRGFTDSVTLKQNDEGEYYLYTIIDNHKGEYYIFDIPFDNVRAD